MSQLATGRDTRLAAAASQHAPFAFSLVGVLATLGFERLELLADTRNEPSLRVGEKAGFRREGVIRSARTNARDGLRVDHALYSLLRSELAQ